MWHPCPDCAKCLTPGRLYDPSACTPCQTFLEDMQQDPSASSLASRTWMKWNRTMVNRWKKNNVALYSPTNVRMLIWADSTLFHTYEAVLPPAPPPRSASKDSLCSVGRPEASPAPPVDTLLEHDRSSPWSGFEEVLPPNQEARPRSPTVPHTDPTLPLSPAIPPSQPTQSQPPSDPMMAMFQSLMSSFQSEIKTLRDDLSGSMSTMVAEAVAAHLPQVPYQFQSKIFLFMCLFIVHMLMLLICSPYKCYTLQCSPYNCYTLQTIPRLLVVYCTFLSPTFVRLLQSHLLQSCPWPHRSRDHPHRWCPLTSPNRDLPGYIAQWFWLVYILIILFFLDHSVCFVHLDRLSSCYIYVPYTLFVSYNQFVWVRWYFSVFHFPHSTGGQKGCGQGYGAGGPQEKGPTSLSTQPTIAQTTQTGRSPTSGRTSEYVLGMHFSCHYLSIVLMYFLFIVHYRVY